MCCHFQEGAGESEAAKLLQGEYSWLRELESEWQPLHIPHDENETREALGDTYLSIWYAVSEKGKSNPRLGMGSGHVGSE